MKIHCRECSLAVILDIQNDTVKYFECEALFHLLRTDCTEPVTINNMHLNTKWVCRMCILLQLSKICEDIPLNESHI